MYYNVIRLDSLQELPVIGREVERIISTAKVSWKNCNIYKDSGDIYVSLISKPYIQGGLSAGRIIGYDVEIYVLTGQTLVLEVSSTTGFNWQVPKTPYPKIRYRELLQMKPPNNFCYQEYDIIGSKNYLKGGYISVPPKWKDILEVRACNNKVDCGTYVYGLFLTDK